MCDCDQGMCVCASCKLIAWCGSIVHHITYNWQNENIDLTKLTEVHTYYPDEWVVKCTLRILHILPWQMSCEVCIVDTSYIALTNELWSMHCGYIIYCPDKWVMKYALRILHILPWQMSCEVCIVDISHIALTNELWSMHCGYFTYCPDKWVVKYALWILYILPWQMSYGICIVDNCEKNEDILRTLPELVQLPSIEKQAGMKHMDD